ncbi:MAG TPA: glycosyltransferase [Vicinamibacterales bacterium]|nr:glycosyltransferase [Vicinamibacterales bacterium]
MTAHIRVVVLSTYQEPCGIASYTKDLLPELQALGVDAIVLSPRARKGSEGWGSQPRLWNRNRAFGFEAVRVYRAIRDFAPDIVHAQINPSLFSSRFVFTLGRLLRRARIPLVATLHGRGGGSIGRRFKLARLLVGLRHAHLVVHSDAHARELSRERVHVIPHGVEAPHAIDPADARAMLGIADSNRTIVAHFGFLVPDKGVLEVLEAVAMLRAKGRRDLHYWISGAVNGDRDSRRYFDLLERRVRELGLRDHVHLTGEFVSEQRSLVEISASDWIVLAYHTGNNQGASGAVRRAIATGRPVAVSSAPVFDDVRDATHTLTGPLDSALERLLDDSALGREVAARGRRFCEEHSWANVAARHVALYSTIAVG